MQDSDFYNENDYRLVVLKRLKALKMADAKRYSAHQLAKYCRVHPPFLSAVLNAKMHFNHDQLFLASKFLGLANAEQEYLELLFDWNRSASRIRQEELQRRLSVLRQRSTSTSHVLPESQPDIGLGEWQEYFLRAEHQMVHMALTVDRFRKSPELLLVPLQMSSEGLTESLRLLQRLSLIELTDGHWQVSKDMLHLPDDSKMVHFFQQAARVKALARPQRPDDLRFTVYFTADRPSHEKIRREFNKFLKAVQGIVKPAPAEGVFQLNCDLMQWDVSPTV